jgi:hypothetical protein
MAEALNAKGLVPDLYPPSGFLKSVQAEERFAGMGMQAGATLHGTSRFEIASQWRLPAVALRMLERLSVSD